jgi:hypothetical protein
MIAAGILGAACADARGFLSANAAGEGHSGLFLPPVGGRLSDDGAAALGFLVHHPELLFARSGKIDDVILQALAVAAIFSNDAREHLRIRGSLVLPNSLPKRRQQSLHALYAKEDFERAG